MPNLDAMISKAFSIALLVLDSWLYCVKSVCIRNYSVSYFPEFGLKMKRYSVCLRIQSECEKIWTRITSNMDIFYVVQLNICYEIVNFWLEDDFIKCILIHRRHLLVLHKEKFFLNQQYFPQGQEYSVFLVFDTKTKLAISIHRAVTLSTRIPSINKNELEKTRKNNALGFLIIEICWPGIMKSLHHNVFSIQGNGYIRKIPFSTKIGYYFFPISFQCCEHPENLSSSEQTR